MLPYWLSPFKMAIGKPWMIESSVIILLGLTFVFDHLANAQEHRDSFAASGQSESVRRIWGIGLHANNRQHDESVNEQQQAHQTFQESPDKHSKRILLSSSATLLDDVQALLEFKKFIVADPLHVMANWVVTDNDPSSHCHKWNGVACNSNLQVVTLGLAVSQLNGTISPSIGNLAYLSHLDLTSNNLSGNIPSSLQNCTNLTKLYLGFNQLTGNIPTEIGQLSLLQELLLFWNKFTGECT